MRVAIIAPGSRGDIQPYVPLGVGLSRAGHDVRVVTNRDHAALVKSHGLDLWALDVDVQAALQSEKVSASLESGSHVASFRQLAEIAKRGTEQLIDVGLEACKGVDVIVTGLTGSFLGEGFAARFGVPLVQALNVPLTSTSAYPGALLPGFSSLGPWGRRVSHLITRQAIWMMTRSTANTLRKERLGVPSAPLFLPNDRPGIAPGPVLYGFSPEVLPRSPDWGEDIEITGYWFADEPEGWSPPAALEDFLAKGPKPVCIGFGSMSQRDPEGTTRLVLDAISRSGQRAILIAGWGGLKSNDLPGHVFQVDSIPHSWLYPRMAAVVHHGGAGTTAAGLRAGVPSIVVPFHGDQPFWGRCIENLGVGPAPVPRNRLTAEKLARAIHLATSDPSIGARAAMLGQKIRNENGIARAVAAITRLSAP